MALNHCWGKKMLSLSLSPRCSNGGDHDKCQVVGDLWHLANDKGGHERRMAEMNGRDLHICLVDTNSHMLQIRNIFITIYIQPKKMVHMYNNRWIFQSTTKNKNWRRLLSPFIQQSIRTCLQLRNSPTGHPTGFLHVFSNYHAHLESGSLSLYYPQSSKYLVSRFDPPHTLWEGLLEASNTSSQGIRMILDD